MKRLLGQYRGLLVWDNFESVAEMPDPAGATPPLDEAGRAQLREFLHWVRDHSRSAVIITSRAREDWLGEVRRIAVGGLNRAEAAEYAGLLLAPFPAAQRRRERPSFGELLDWLDGHPLAMRLTLPRLQDADPAELLAALRGTAPLPGGEEAGAGRLSSLGACITYSFAHLTEPARRLLPALSLFTGIADAERPGALLRRRRGAGPVRRDQQGGVDGGAGGRGPGRAAVGDRRRHVPDPPGAARLPRRRLAGRRTPAATRRNARHPSRPCAPPAPPSAEWLTGQIESGDAAFAYTLIGLQRRTLGAMLGHALDHHAWGDAEKIVRALDAYWDTRGLGGEAAAWADRILAATAVPGQGPAAATRSLWLFTLGRQAARQQDAGQPDQAAQTYRQILTWLQGQPETEWTRGNIAVTYHRLGMTAQARGRLDEAEDWYRKSLAIEEELGDRPSMAMTYHQLGYTAQDRGQAG